MSSANLQATGDAQVQKGQEGKAKIGSQLGSNIKVENAGQVDPADRQSTQALLEELKKSVAPKVHQEERKSEL